MVHVCSSRSKRLHAGQRFQFGSRVPAVSAAAFGHAFVNAAGPDWETARAPSLADFQRIADAAFAGLPERLRGLCHGVVIHIEDFPDDETLDEMQCESEFDLLGLFRGQGLAQSDASAPTGRFPNMIWLYRRPILDYWASHDESLDDIIGHVLIHEIGHHFGLSDADMERIERDTP
jgi:predicted Zn-dependent protease with MMP-like domain